MTIKLYNISAYESSFTATVLRCEPEDGGFSVLLHQTLFFPEAGGQSCDSGRIAGLPVLWVEEKAGEIFHHLPSPLPVGETVQGEIDFPARYRKMQCHTGEHIFSGTLHRLYGCDNVGFHLGDDGMTVDTDRFLTAEEIAVAEAETNAAIRRNLPVEVLYPTPEEAAGLLYRSKKEITSELRIVRIGDVDTCACCAPHVKATGEVGLLKVTECRKHKSGVRMKLLAAADAVSDYQEKHRTAVFLSQLLSVPPEKIQEPVQTLLQETGRMKGEIAALRREILRREAAELPATTGNICLFTDCGDLRILSETAFSLRQKAGGVSVVLCGAGSAGYRFAMASEKSSLSVVAEAAHQALGGKSGGNAELFRGTFTAEKEAIAAFFRQFVPDAPI